MYLGKDVENRSREDGRLPAVCHHRGPLLIHVSASCSAREYEEAVEWMRAARLISAVKKLPPFSEMHLGHIVCALHVHAHVDAMGTIWETPHASAGKRSWSRWRAPLSPGLLLSEMRPLAKPVPYKGQLGIYEVPDTLVSA